MTTIPAGWQLEELKRKDSRHGLYAIHVHTYDDGLVIFSATHFPRYGMQDYANETIGGFDTLAEAVAACTAHEHALIAPAAYGPIGIDADGRPVTDV